MNSEDNLEGMSCAVCQECRKGGRIPVARLESGLQAGVGHLKHLFPCLVSYNRFAELEKKYCLL